MSLIFDGTNGLTLPSWTSAARPASPTGGQMGYNSTLGGIEVYNSVSGNWDLLTGGPAFSAYQTAGSAYGSATPTKVQFQTKEYDTASAFDNTTNYRFQPSVPGYYQINGGVSGGVQSSYYSVNIYKNGVAYKTGGSYTTSGVTPNGAVSSVVALNGTSDYVEIWVNAASGSTTYTGIASTYFNGAYLRGL